VNNISELTGMDKHFKIHFEKRIHEIEYYENMKICAERAERLTKEMLISASFKLWKISEVCNMQLTSIISEIAHEFSEPFIRYEMKLKRLKKFPNNALLLRQKN
jgi:hypothetical protein